MKLVAGKLSLYLMKLVTVDGDLYLAVGLLKLLVNEVLVQMVVVVVETAPDKNGG